LVFLIHTELRRTVNHTSEVQFVAVQCEASCLLRFRLVTQASLQCCKEIRKVNRFQVFLSKYSYLFGLWLCMAGLLLVAVLCQFCYTHFPIHYLKNTFRATNKFKTNIFPEIFYMMQGEEFRVENGKFRIEFTNIDKCN